MATGKGLIVLGWLEGVMENTGRNLICHLPCLEVGWWSLFCPKKEVRFLVSKQKKTQKCLWNETCGEVAYHKLFYSILKFTSFTSQFAFVQQPKHGEFPLDDRNTKEAGNACAQIWFGNGQSIGCLGLETAVEHRSPFPSSRCTATKQDSQRRFCRSNQVGAVRFCRNLGQLKNVSILVTFSKKIKGKKSSKKGNSRKTPARWILNIKMFMFQEIPLLNPAF